MKCCLCKKQIDIIGTWKQGHNAQPLADGRCCSNCNNTVVKSARLGLTSEDKE